MAKKPKSAPGKVLHVVPVPVQENIEHQMYLRAPLVNGVMPDGRKIELDQSGASLILQVGDWRKPGGRQFTLNFASLVKAMLDHLEPASTEAPPAGS